MKSKITQSGGDLEITLAEIDKGRDQLLRAFQACQTGKCSCPTREYEKLESLEIENLGEELRLSMKAKSGEKIDPDTVAACLHYTESAIKGDR